jgi:hypothetical protein
VAIVDKSPTSFDTSYSGLLYCAMRLHNQARESQSELARAMSRAASQESRWRRMATVNYVKRLTLMRLRAALKKQERCGHIPQSTIAGCKRS